MPYNFVADSIHKKKLCSRLSSIEVRLYAENGRFAFLSHHRKLVGKRVVDLLLVLIELFSLDVTAEALRAVIGSKSAI